VVIQFSATAHAKLLSFFFLFFYFIYSKNSGRPQGKLVRRHKVLKSGHETKDEDGRGGRDDESPDKYWHWKDLNVASDVDIFGRRFRLTNCNQWTRVNKKEKRKNVSKIQIIEFFPLKEFQYLICVCVFLSKSHNRNS
jgi:hypothetical protein